MKLKLLVGLSDGSNIGDIIECGADEAGRMIASRFALPYADKPVERAVMPAPVEVRSPKPRRK
jgi:hypothetical protein